jgi:hypothetical protein
MVIQVDQRVVDTIRGIRGAGLSPGRDGTIYRAEQLAERGRFFLSPATDKVVCDRQVVELCEIPETAGYRSGRL